MRTTLDLDSDVVQAAKELARSQKTSLGKVISRLSRSALLQKGEITTAFLVPVQRNGVPILPVRPGEVVTMKHIRALEDAE